MSRRAWLAGTATCVVALAAVPASGARVAAHGEETEASGDLAGVELPPPLGETDLRVFVEETGHTVGGFLLDYWRATGGPAVFGHPISEPFVAADGLYSQAFERGIFQYRPEFLFTVEPIVRLMPIGRTALADRVGLVRADGKRGGGDRRDAAWAPLRPGGATASRAIAEGGGVDVETGHSISGAFLDWYEEHEGGFYLGRPLGEPVAERGTLVQYFDGGLLMAHGDGTALAPLGTQLAARLGLDTAPVEQADLPVYDESLFRRAANPNPAGGERATGPKRIEINLSEQRLWAYQGGALVTTGLVTTGLAPNVTEQGWFRVRLKYPVQDMAGFVGATGEVLDVGAGTDVGVAGAVDSYQVADVPDVMYFNLDAEALHGAYWRDVFGAPGSHGCVNLPVDMAAFLYGWTPLGTPVWVHE